MPDPKQGPGSLPPDGAKLEKGIGSERLFAPPEAAVRRPRKRRRWLKIALVVAVLAVVGGAIYHWLTHHKLFIVNRHTQDVNVALGGSSWHVRAGERKQVTLRDGPYRAVITTGAGEPVETVALTIRRGTHVLNVRAAAVILWREIVYTEKPRPDAPVRYKLHFGKSFLAFPTIDYPFSKAPDTITVDEGKGPQHKTALSVLEEPPSEVFGYFPEKTRPAVLVKFLEHFLTRDPEDAALLGRYTYIACQEPFQKRALAFLEKGLDRRPTVVGWHELCQQLAVDMDRGENLVARYDALLAAEPNDATLLYLKGSLLDRLARSTGAFHPQAVALYDRAVAADAASAHAWHAKALVLYRQGQFAEAKRAAAEACRLEPDDAATAGRLRAVRFALKEYAPLIAQARAQLKDNPLDSGRHQRLLQLLMASGSRDEALQAQEQFAKTVEAKLKGADPEQRVLDGRFSLLYLDGAHDETLELVKQAGEPFDIPYIRFRTLLEKGDLDEAERAVPEHWAVEAALLLRVAYLARRNAEKAKTWLGRATGPDAVDTTPAAAVARLLSRDPPPETQDIEGLNVPLWLKSLAFVDLAARRPDLRAAALARARHFNPDTFFPHRFLNDTIAALQQQTPP